MIGTDRLLLRRWRESDIDPFHAMGNDAEVMRFIGPLMSFEQAEETVARQNTLADSYGSCFWAAERRKDGRFIGFCGIKPGPDGTPLAGQPEIGWRLARDAWGQGYAREAAQACLDWGWRQTDWPEVGAMTVLANTRSWGLMERLGMTRHPDQDFDHPALAPGDALRRHIVYRLRRPAPDA